ncbi:MAG: protein kinase [Pirellulales bacterium]
MSTSSDERLPVEVLAEEFLDRLRRGEQPTVAEYAQRYPEQAAAIRELFPAMLVLERLSVPDPSERPLLPETSAVAAVPAVLGDYRLLRPIGWGGMGIVFEAEDVSLGRHVAVKVLPPEPRRDDVARQRFLREAQVAASLHHSNIVPVFGAGQQAGWHYYVMQLVSGSSLDRVVRALRQMRADREAARETAADSQAARLAQRMWHGSWAESSEKVADRRWDEPHAVTSTDEPSETSTADAAPRRGKTGASPNRATRTGEVSRRQRTGDRWRPSVRRQRWLCSTLTNREYCIAISSRLTCCSTSTAASG